MAELRRLELEAGGRTYAVLVGRGALTALPRELDHAGLEGRLRVVVDQEVMRLRGAELQAALDRCGREAQVLAISGAERHKNLTTVSRVYDWLIEVGTIRSDIVVALGGGVVGDLVGFVAATFLRGLRMVQVPTTLLAMVDSSIGGKTGVDHPAGKNLIGAFHQPSLVVADVDLLDTLPQRELVAGWAEVIKMGMVASAELFVSLEASPPTMLELGAEAEWAIARSIELKGRIVAKDERESDLRMILNYGHTVGHAIEAVTNYKRYLHGEAVAIGMTAAASIALRRGRLEADAVARQSSLLDKFQLPRQCPDVDAASLWAPLRKDKKSVGSGLRWVLPTGIGAAEVDAAVPEPLVAEILERLVRD